MGVKRKWEVGSADCCLRCDSSGPSCNLYMYSTMSLSKPLHSTVSSSASGQAREIYRDLRDYRSPVRKIRSLWRSSSHRLRKKTNVRGTVPPIHHGGPRGLEKRTNDCGHLGWWQWFKRTSSSRRYDLDGNNAAYGLYEGLTQSQIQETSGHRNMGF